MAIDQQSMGDGETPQRPDSSDHSPGDTHTLSLTDAAAQLGISVKTARRWIKSGKLPAELVDGPYGQEYRVLSSAITVTREVVDVVRVERANDPQALAMVIVQAVDQAIERRERPLLDLLQQQSEAMAELHKDLTAVRLQLAKIEGEQARAAAAVQTTGQDVDQATRAPRWQFWRRR